MVKGSALDQRPRPSASLRDGDAPLPATAERKNREVKNPFGNLSPHAFGESAVTDSLAQDSPKKRIRLGCATKTKKRKQSQVRNLTFE
jgi:hypothetical protein